ncbi:bacillithiol transferase BstA [Cohnella sp. CFH 77786]|uniref:YfiT family bacillithiol transferase n=1 Tax=Cohnella sp. CFH 77786 TaxID=2662265 RepID=UPI001C60AA2C|nr:bacillithiol transferase BstA [Cohnella sp. CFH 77786]MBW5448106.1 bacillithiol transferase BstA [Cohnella sp. CFH 77786]
MTIDLRYPVGKFSHEGEITPSQREEWIREIEQLPERLAAAVSGLSQDQLDTPYRDGGWTVRQVAHHVADSHMNSIMRFKLALTESEPAIKPYDENAWAQLEDTRQAPIEHALDSVRSLHARWVLLLRSMSDADFAKTFYHPENKRVSRLDRTLGLYAWHGRHHVAHITGLRERMGW